MSIRTVLRTFFAAPNAKAARRRLRRKHTQRQSVLCAWELGRGLGHVHRLIVIAREIASHVTQVTFALRQLDASRQVSSAMPGAKVVQAPVHVSQPTGGNPLRRSAHNYADMLHACGYDPPDSLASLVASWQALFDSVQPSLIVCDHSPTVILAAAGYIPVIHIGSGFACPPAGVPFLSLYPPAAEGGKEREAAVLVSIAQVRSRFGQTLPSQVSDLFRWAECFPCCLPELDPYSTVRAGIQIGTIHRLPEPAPDKRGGFLFGYLTGEDPRVLGVLQSLCRMKIKCSLFVRDISADWVKETEGTSVRLFDAPQQINEIIAASDGVIHHGGVTTTESALAIGRPQFILPRYVEQGLTAEAVEKMGCGLNLSMVRDDVGLRIHEAMKGRDLARGAQLRAREIAARSKLDRKAQILAACMRHLCQEAGHSVNH